MDETGTNNGQYTVSLTNQSSTATTISYSVTGTATSGVDFTALSGTITIPALTSSGTIDLTILTDAIVEVSESVIVTLSSITSGDADISIDAANDEATIIIPDNDVSTVTIAATTQAAEPASDGLFTISFSNPVSTPTTVTYAVGGTAGGGIDYTALSNTVVMPAMNTSVTIPVDVIDDNIVETGGETVIVSLVSTSNAVVTPGAPDEATVTIADNDASVATITATTSAAEPSTNGLFTVNLSNPVSVATTITYTVLGSATAGTDYTALSGSVLIPAFATSATIPVVVIDDNILEGGGETVFVTLQTTSNAVSIGFPSVTSINIADDDASAVSIVATTQAAEPSTNGLFTLSLSNPVSIGTTVNFTVTGTATSGTDYTSIGAIAFFPAMSTTATIILPVLDDNIVETGGETVIVTLTGTSNAVTVGAPSAATITIADNDASSVSIAATTQAAEPASDGLYTLSLSNPVNIPTLVTYNVIGTATPGADYTALTGTVEIPALSTSATITVDVIDDNIVETGGETVVVTLVSTNNAVTIAPTDAGPAITITDDDASAASIVATTQAGEPSSNGLFTITLSNPVSVATTITYAVTGTATQGTDYAAVGTTVLIPALSTSATIPVTVIDDNIVETGGETVLITLLSTNTAVTIGAPPAATVTITDNDAASVSIAATASAAEPVTNGLFTLTLTNPVSTATTVNFSVGGSGTNGTDYNNIGNSVVIPANTTTKTINITVIDDNLVEPGGETVIVTLTGTNNAVTLGAPTAATIAIADDDASSVSITKMADGAEPATPGHFVINLTNPLKIPTMVYFTVSGTATAGSDYSGFGTNVFIPSYTTFADIFVPVIDDILVEPVETIIVTVTGTNNVVTLGAPLTATVNIGDNDAASLAVDDVTVIEMGGNAVFTVTLSGNTVQNAFTVNYATADNTAAAPGDYTATSGTLTFGGANPTSQNVIVPIIDDVTFEPTETFFLNLSNILAGGQNVGFTDAQGVGTITDEDFTEISVSKTGNASVVLGTMVNYDITVTNEGPNDALNVSITDILPAAINSPQYSVNNGIDWFPWTGPTLGLGTLYFPANATKQVLIRGTVNLEACATLSNTATVSSTTYDMSTLNNSSTWVTTVVDNTDPEISCPFSGTQTLVANQGNCTYELGTTAWDATADDNCGVTSLTYSLSGAMSGSGTSVANVEFVLGTTTVTWTALDAAGNSSSCSYDITVTPNLTVSVSIGVDQNPVCSGNLVTFTAYPVNGGATPYYQWFKNGSPVGSNSPVYSYIPSNNDEIYVALTSSLICAINNPAYSNIITMIVNTTVTPSVSIVVSDNNICAGTGVTYTATPVNGGTNPVYQWYRNSLPVGSNSPTYVLSPANGDQVYVMMTSNAVCPSANPATSNTITMVVNPLLPVSVSITASENNVCAGASVTYTAVPVNGGTTPAYQWYLNTAPVGTNSPQYTHVPANGDLVYVVMTSNATCTTGNPATSNTLTMTVSTLLPASVSITASANNVCTGTGITFTALPVNGGATPAYQWYKNGLPVGTNSPSYNTVPLNGDQVYVVMTSSATCATGSPATSNTVTMIVNPLLPVSVTIAPSDNNICTGTLVTFTASPVNGGTMPAYQWYKNGSPVGGNNLAYSYVPSNGDQVYVVLTSNASCATANPATSNTITMVVLPLVTPSVIVTASTNNVCTGTSVTFTATPGNGGTAPVYQWYKNNVPVGTNNPTYTYNPANNDQIRVVMNSDIPCAQNPAYSNVVTMTIYPVIPVSVSISASANNICAGTSVTYTATPVGGGTTPTYQWFRNFAPVGTNSPTYTYTPSNGDQVYVELTSSAPCPLNNPAYSNFIVMDVDPLFPVSVTVTPSANNVCAGASVTFTALPVNGGSTPTYQWYVNNLPVGTNSSSYAYVPANGDQVNVVLTSSVNCTSGSPATSNTVAMVVNPVLPVSVSIAASNNNVCAGTSITFTATPVNAGVTPGYQWYKNGAMVGTNSPVYTYVPSNGDQVYVVLNSSAPCTTGNPATSNMVTLVINPILPVSVNLSVSDNPVCAGTSVTFTATPVNGGSSPVYEWFKNGAPVGTNSPTYSYVPVNGDQVYVRLTSNANCTTGNPANSFTLTMAVNPVLPVSVSIVANGNNLCAGSMVTFTATQVNGGSSPFYQWYKNNVAVGTNSPTYTYYPANGDQVWVVMTSNATCPSGNPATSNTVTMIINALQYVDVSIIASDNGICEGTTVTYTATPVNGGTSPVYQWYLNSNPVGTNSPVYSTVPNDGDLVWVVLTSNINCYVNNPATSNTVSMTVNPILPASVSITESVNDVCAGTSVTFTATPVNGGSNPTYQWYVNNVMVGTNSVAYTYVPANGDLVYVVMTSDEDCVSGSPATSNTLEMQINPLMPVIVNIAVDANNVCTGTLVTFTATPINGGSAPEYQWFKNGFPVGTNSPVYTMVPVNGDQVYVTLTSDLTCATSNPATSAMITMVVNPQLPVSVSITASQNPICTGTSVIFTAVPVNGGSAPAYQWYLNNLPVGSNSNTYTYLPANGDQVYVVMTSDEECISGNPASSNTIVMSVNNSLPASVSIVVSANPVCPGTNVTFTAFGVNGGDAPVYQWYRNNIPVGFNSMYYNDVPNPGDQVYVVMTSSAVCATGSPATSNTIIMQSALPAPAGTITGTPAVCVGQSNVTYTVPVIPNAVIYTWSYSGTGVSIIGNTNTVIINFSNTATSGNLTVWGTNICGFGPISPTYAVTVNPLPAVTWNTVLPVQCEGGTPLPLFGGLPVNGTYSGPGVSGNAFDPDAVGMGSYLLTYSFTDPVSGCTNYTTNSVTVEPLPGMPGSISGLNTVCQNQGDVEYTVDPVPGALSYAWTLPPNAVIIAGEGTNTITVDFLGNALTGEISVFAVNNCGFGPVSTEFEVVVNYAPAVDAGPPVTVNAGSSAVLNGSLSGGLGPYSILWSPGSALDDSTILNPLVTPLATTTYTLLVTDANGCYGEDTTTVTVNDTLNTVTGRITYNNYLAFGISGVHVHLLQQDTIRYSAISSAGGYYTLAGIEPGIYKMRADKVGNWGGVNATDAMIISLYFVQSLQLSPIQIMAADVNANGFVNAVDALVDLNRFVAIINSFPAGDWAFDTLTVNITSDTLIDLKGLNMGDVNGSRTLMKAEEPAVEILESGTLEIPASGTFELPVKASHDMVLGSVSLVLNYPDDCYEFLGVTARPEQGKFVYNEKDGEIRIGWYDISPLILNQENTLFSLQMRVRNSSNSIQEGMILSTSVESVFADPFAREMERADLTVPKIVAPGKGNAFVLQNAPNPFSDFTTFNLQLPEEGMINMKIYDAKGVMIQNPVREEWRAAGNHDILFDGSMLPPGAYWYTLEFRGTKSDLQKSGKLIIVR
ncbi:MAG: Calx-beta domain-containing protein [Bacteroidales bacterium]